MDENRTPNTYLLLSPGDSTRRATQGKRREPPVREALSTQGRGELTRDHGCKMLDNFSKRSSVNPFTEGSDTFYVTWMEFK